MRLPSELPIVQAPMAGGPGTPALVAGVSAAGAYGFLAAGYLNAATLRAEIATTRSLTGAAFGVNLFVPSTPADVAEVAAYGRRLAGEAARLGTAVGEGRWDDDDFETKLEVVAAEKVHLVSFTFGCPAAIVVEQLHRAGVLVAVTVTSAAEASIAARVGSDLLAVQGTEAGGHQGSFVDLSPNERPLLVALSEVRDAVSLPMIGTGGVMHGSELSRVLGAGAIAVALGTAFLCADEAGTSVLHRRALVERTYPDTVVTRAYSGRYARGLANRSAVEHTAAAPQAYPEVNNLTRPLRAAAVRAGDSSMPNLWAGSGWQKIVSAPARVIVEMLAGQAQSTS